MRVMQGRANKEASVKEKPPPSRCSTLGEPTVGAEGRDLGIRGGTWWAFKAERRHRACLLLLTKHFYPKLSGSQAPKSVAGAHKA